MVLAKTGKEKNDEKHNGRDTGSEKEKLREQRGGWCCSGSRVEPPSRLGRTEDHLGGSWERKGGGDVSILTQFFLLLQELVENTTGWIPEIVPTPRGPCLESSGGKVEPKDQTPAGFRAAPMALSVSSAATPSRLPLAAFLLGQGTLSWLLATLQAGV